MTDPFEEVEPLEDVNPLEALTVELTRSMLWDMVGPDRMWNEPALFNQQPASPDVIEAEANEMWARKYSLLPFGMDFPFLCYMAAEAASLAILSSDKDLRSLTDEDKMKFRVSNVKMGTAIVETVVSHMLQKGLIKYGERDEFLGEQAQQQDE